MSVKKHSQRIIILTLVGVFILSSAGLSGLVIWDSLKNKNKDQDTSTQQKENTLAGTQLQNFTPITKVSSLKVEDIKVGTGKEATASSTVTAHYTGASATTGIIFESSKDSGQPATFPLAQVIKGWQQGVPGMKEGGIRRLIIPAELAYGSMGAPPKIGPNEPLVFDIELISVQ